MVGEMTTVDDEQQADVLESTWTRQFDRGEVLNVAAQILGGQSAYRADTQSKNLKAIVAAAKELICEVNESLTEEAGHSKSISKPLQEKFTPSFGKSKSKTPYGKPQKSSKKV